MTRWQQFGSGDIFKWETEGEELVGRWIGVRKGDFGLLGMIEKGDGVKVSFPLTTSLTDLQELKDGVLIRIVFKGYETSKAGRTFKNFSKFVEEGSGNEDDEDNRQLELPSVDSE